MDSNNEIINIIKTYSTQIGLDSNLIKRINITVYDDINEWIGKVNSINIDENLYFELLFQKSLFENIPQENSTEYQKFKSIIMHELYHCKEMYITLQNIDNWTDVYYHDPITTTKLLFLDTGFHQWSEYYAYYNSSKIHEREVDISHNISKAEASLEVLYNEIQIKNLHTIKIINCFLSDIINFIHKCIQLIAHYNSTHSKKYVREFNHYSRSKLYQNYYPYLKDLSHYMDDLYQTYPHWVSESAFIEIGRKLFSFIRIQNLEFISQDLSDNFEVKIIE